MKNLKTAAIAVITAVVSTLGLVAAPVSTAASVEYHFDNVTDYSCGQPGKVTFATRRANSSSPGVTRWLVDSYNGNLDPNSMLSPGIERTLPATEPLFIAGKKMTSAQRAQIGYLVNSLGQLDHLEAELRYGTLWRAIGIIAGIPNTESACAYLNEPAQQAVSRVAGITGPGSGQVSVVPEISNYDPDTGTVTVRDIAIIDAGNGFDLTSISGSRFDVTLSVRGGSLTPDGTTTSTTVTTQSGSMAPITIYVDRPGQLTITTETTGEVPSTDLHIFEENYGAVKFGIGLIRSAPHPHTTTLTATTPRLRVTATNITPTSVDLVTAASPKFTQGQNGAVVALTGLSGSQSRTVSLEEPTHEFTGLTPNTRYAVTYTRTDALAAPANAVFTTGPVAPTNLHTTAGPTSLNLSWQLAPGATSYEITVGNIKRTVTGTTTQITELKPATTYPVTVQALNLPARGAAVTGEARTTLAPPGKVTVTRATSMTVTLSWPQVDHATSYRLTLDGHRGIWEPSAPTATLTGLTQGRTYTGTLIALADGETPSSSRFTFTAIPSVANDIKVTTTTPTSMGLSWRSGSPGTRYTVKVVGNHGRTITTRDSAVTITGLKANKSYRISIQAANAAGTSGWSPALTVRTTKKTKAKITVRRNTRKTRIKVTRAPSARVKVQRKKAGVWRTIRRKRAVRNKLQLSVIITKSARLRVVVAATPSTRQTKRVVR